MTLMEMMCLRNLLKMKLRFMILLTLQMN